MRSKNVTRLFFVGVIVGVISSAAGCIRYRPLIADDKTQLETLIIGQYAETGFNPFPQSTVRHSSFPHLRSENTESSNDALRHLVSRYLILLEQQRSDIIDLKQRGLVKENRSGLVEPTEKLLSRENDVEEQSTITKENRLREQLGVAIENYAGATSRKSDALSDAIPLSSQDYVIQYSAYRKRIDRTES